MLVLGSASAQNIYYVDNSIDESGDFTSLQDAIDVSQSGDYIYIYGSLYGYGDITINKQINIIGPGIFLDENYKDLLNKSMARVNDVNIVTGAENSYLAGLYFTGDLILHQTSNIIIEKSKIYTKQHRIEESHYIGYYRNYFSDNGSSNNTIFIHNFSSNISFKKNIFKELNLDSGQYVEFMHNIFLNQVKFNSATVMGNVFLGENPIDLDGLSNIKFNVLTDPTGLIPDNSYVRNQSSICVGFPSQNYYSTDSRFQLKDNSPAEGAGPNGTDCGIFGSPNPYVISGLASVPFITELNAPFSAQVGDTIRVELKAMVR